MQGLFEPSYYTRYVLPGLIFTTTVLVLPTIILWPVVIAGIGIVEGIFILIVAVTTGYVLDVLGVYRLNWGYRQTKIRFFDWVSRLYPAALQDELQLPASISNPKSNGERTREEAVVRAGEIILNYVWSRAPEVISRIENSRAKWVLALESSFSFLLSALIWGSLLVSAIVSKLVFQANLFRYFPYSSIAGFSFEFQCIIVAVLAIGFYFLHRRARLRGFDWQFTQNEQAIFLLREAMQKYFADGLPNTHILVGTYRERSPVFI